VAKFLDFRHRDEVKMNIRDPNQSFHYFCIIASAPASPAIV
jgi:hypothetical protein